MMNWRCGLVISPLTYLKGYWGQVLCPNLTGEPVPAHSAHLQMQNELFIFEEPSHLACFEELTKFCNVLKAIQESVLIDDLLKL